MDYFEFMSLRLVDRTYEICVEQANLVNYLKEEDIPVEILEHPDFVQTVKWNQPKLVKFVPEHSSELYLELIRVDHLNMIVQEYLSDYKPELLTKECYVALLRNTWTHRIDGFDVLLDTRRICQQMIESLDLEIKALGEFYLAQWNHFDATHARDTVRKIRLYNSAASDLATVCREGLPEV